MLLVITIAVFLLIISVVVLVHEAGHFFVARKFVIRVEEFGFGFPPRIVGFKKGETTYSINWLFVGGFVKLYGEDEAGRGSIGKPTTISAYDKKKAFIYKPGWQKLLVVFAGVFMNFVLAFVVLTFIFAFIGVQVPSGKIVIANVIKNSPAYKSGLRKNDLIVAIDDIHIHSVNQVISAVKNHEGEKIVLMVQEKSGKFETVRLVPRKTYPENQGPTGILIAETTVSKKYVWYKAPFVGISQAFSESWLILSGVGIVFSQLLFHGKLSSGVLGPVGIVQFTGELISYAGGFSSVISFVPLFSLNLAIVNMLPIPALDGGRMLFILIELITRKKIDVKTQSVVNAIGMAIILALVVLLTIHDIQRLFLGQKIIPKP